MSLVPAAGTDDSRLTVTSPWAACAGRFRDPPRRVGAVLFEDEKIRRMLEPNEPERALWCWLSVSSTLTSFITNQPASKAQTDDVTSVVTSIHYVTSSSQQSARYASFSETGLLLLHKYRLQSRPQGDIEKVKPFLPSKVHVRCSPYNTSVCPIKMFLNGPVFY